MTIAALTRRIPGAANWPVWLTVALVIKSVFFIISLNQGYEPHSDARMAARTGDSRSYTDPIDHLVEAGSYDPDYRMPGYGAAYALLRVFAARRLALDLLVVVQLFVDVLAVYALALAVLGITRSRVGFLLTFALYCAASTISGFNI
jgi:hypothetical protein